MSFVRMDGFFYCGIILAICYLLQPVTPFFDVDPLCYWEERKKEAILKNFRVNSSSESSIHLTWDFSAYEYNESDATTSCFKYSKQADNFFLEYLPSVLEEMPRLVYSPPFDLYEVRYNVNDLSFQPWKIMNLSVVKTYHMPSTQMQVNVTNLPFPGWPYTFRLCGYINGAAFVLPSFRVNTSPALPKVCAGCFLTLWTRRGEQKRKVRVYWPRREGQQVSFLLSVRERSSNHTTTLVYEHGPSKIEQKLFDIDFGYIDVVIGMQSHDFQFIERRLNATELPRHSIIVVPDEQNVLEWVPGLSTTIDTETILKMHTLSWEKPKNVEVVKYYTLVWYDKEKCRKNPNLSPMMDWIYIPGNCTSINFKIIGSEENDVGRVGWSLIANTETSSNGLQNFDDR